MATPILTQRTLSGVLGEVLVDVRAANHDVSAPTVVILHGFKGFKDWGMFPPFAERLARAGFAAVSYNSSGSGVDAEGRFAFPDRFGHDTFSAEVSDLTTVLDGLEDGRLGLARPTTVALVGHSRGGGIAVLVAAARPRITALVTWAAISTVQRWPEEMKARWRAEGRLEVLNQRTGEVLPLFTDILDDVERHGSVLEIEAAAERIGVPWLIVHGAEDETVPPLEGRRLAAAAPSAEVLVVERSGHTFGAVHPFLGRTPALDQVFDATIAFLTRHL